MYEFNTNNTKKLLLELDLRTLFSEEIGWGSPNDTKKRLFTVNNYEYTRKPVAQLSGLIVFEVYKTNGELPNNDERVCISEFFEKLWYHHILIFTSKNTCIWRWVTRDKYKKTAYEHYVNENTIEVFISKLKKLFVSLDDLENITIVDATRKVNSALIIPK